MVMPVRARPSIVVAWILGLGAAALGGGSVGCASDAGDESGGAGGGASSSESASSDASTTSTAESSSSESATASASSATGGPVCGDGLIEPPETCEGADFNGKTCASLGLSSGELTCNDFCGIVVSGCIPKEACANQEDDDEDGSADCDDADCAASAKCSDACAAPMVLSVPSFEFTSMTGRPDTLTLGCSGGGREAVYSFVAATTGDVVLDVSFSAFDPAVSIRTACGDPASEIVCKNAVVAPNSKEEVLFPVVAGQAYFIVVEASNGGVGEFAVDLLEVLPESSCDDLDDNDFDGRLDCDDPTTCRGISSACQPGAGALGTPCFQSSDCDANQGDPICLPSQLGFSDGYCSEFCDLTTNDCPGDGQCADLGLSVNGVCLDGCVTSLDCQLGYVCLDEGFPTKVCDRPPEVACNDDHDNDSDGFVDCDDGTSCATSPSCVAGSGAAGQPCQLHNDCASQTTDPFCIDQFNYGWPGGYCAEFCAIGGTDCPTGSACSTAISPNESTSPNGLCLHTCATQTDCRPGYTCTSDGANMVCVK